MSASTANPLVPNVAITIPPYINDIEAATPFLIFDISRNNLSVIQSHLEAIGKAPVEMLEKATKCDEKARVVLKVRTTPEAKRRLFAMRALPEFSGPAKACTVLSIGPPKAGFYVDISTTLDHRRNVSGLIDRLAQQARIGPPAKMTVKAKGEKGADILTWTFFLGREEHLASQLAEGLVDAMGGFLTGDGALTVVGIADMKQLTQAQIDTHARDKYSWRPIAAISDSVITVNSMVRRFDHLEGLEGAGGSFKGADDEGFGSRKRELSQNTEQTVCQSYSGKRRNRVVSPPTSPPASPPASRLASPPASRLASPPASPPGLSPGLSHHRKGTTLHNSTFFAPIRLAARPFFA